MNVVEQVSDEYISIAQYLERVEPASAVDVTGTTLRPDDVDGTDELLITANGQAW